MFWKPILFLPLILEISGIASNSDFVRVGKKRFFIETKEMMNFFGAQQYCRRQGMNLASISSKEENDQLQKFIDHFQTSTGTPFQAYWTSGNNMGDGITWVWMSTGQPVTFTSWRKGDPNNVGGKEFCIEFNVVVGYSDWNDLDCFNKKSFICEKYDVEAGINRNN